ncbi:hypothetical protein VTL71DRAFT_5594 [Oculimacula yallundae]|uniref:Uncharacterized protein n=1 Tax=Oculimacula yallundae TaxID=86028 RepID=A0ABR4C1J9_9HELO
MNEIKTEFQTMSKTEDLEESVQWMLRILDRRRGASAADPRDMICAHLSLCSDTLRRFVLVDYNIHVIDLYTNLAREYIQVTGDLSILTYVKPEQSKRKHHLPSWIPDWTTPIVPHRNPYTSDHVDHSYPHTLDHNHILRFSSYRNDTVVCMMRGPTREEIRNTVLRGPLPDRMLAALHSNLGTPQEYVLDGGLSWYHVASELFTWVSHPAQKVVSQDLFTGLFPDFSTVFKPIALLSPTVNRRGHDARTGAEVDASQSSYQNRFEQLLYEIFPSLPRTESPEDTHGLMCDMSWNFHLSLQALCNGHSTSEAYALMLSGRVYEIPQAARSGDILAVFESYPKEAFVLRPSTYSVLSGDDRKELKPEQGESEAKNWRIVTCSSNLGPNTRMMHDLVYAPFTDSVIKSSMFAII